jgi:hypothetical protein
MLKAFMVFWLHQCEKGGVNSDFEELGAWLKQNETAFDVIEPD